MGEEPLRLSSLGAWHLIATLGAPREGPGLAAVADPAGDGSLVNLYVTGGRSAGGVVLDTIEILPITVLPDTTHVVGDPRAATEVLSVARFQVGTYGVTNRDEERD